MRAKNIFNKHNFSIGSMSVKDDCRTGIRVNSLFTEVTNGHFLFHMPTPEVVAEDLPLSKRGIDLEDGDVNFAIPISSAKEIERNISKDPTMPILEHTWIEKGEMSEKNDPVSFVMTDFETEKIITVQPSIERFPNTEAIWPKGEPEIEIGFNLDYMIKLCQQFAKSDDRGARILKLKIYRKEEVMMLESTKEEGQKPKALLMPCKI